MTKRAVTDRTKYPSARLTGMKDFMQWATEIRQRPAKIDIALFKKLAMAKGKEGEAVKALRFLGIIDQHGVPTSEFDSLRSEYQPTLRRLTETSYADIFNLIPPRMINQKRLVSFFGLPVETAEYQAKLFVWLCEQAGIELPNVEKRFHRARFDKKNQNNSDD